MSDVLSLRYLGVEVYDKKEVKTTQDVLRYDDVDPGHVQTGPLLKGESQSEDLFTGPVILC